MAGELPLPRTRIIAGTNAKTCLTLRNKDKKKVGYLLCRLVQNGLYSNLLDREDAIDILET